jgi:hypothetical protein
VHLIHGPWLPSQSSRERGETPRHWLWGGAHPALCAGDTTLAAQTSDRGRLAGLRFVCRVNRGMVPYMDATFQTLAAALDLGEFTVDMLARRAAVKPGSVRTVLSRHRHLFQQRRASSGRRGGQARIWRVAIGAQPELEGLIKAIATPFDDDQRKPPARSRVISDPPELVTAEDLEAFTGHRQAQELLPEIVMRLLSATPGITKMSMRVSDGIQLPGFDGIVTSEIAAPYAPLGESVWELGTGKNPRAKLRKDYEERSSNPRGVDPSTTTFVGVSMARIANKDQMVARWRAKNLWHDVRILDADDLYGWLQKIPHVHAWASEQMGLRPADATTLERWLEAWIAQTNPKTPVELVLAGRKIAARELRSALQAGVEPVGVYARSREEALAFTAAALMVEDKDDDYVPAASPLARALVVATPHAWGRLTQSTERTVLIAAFDGPDLAAAVEREHPVAIPMGPSDDRYRATIQVPLLSRADAAAVLRQWHKDVDIHEAERDAVLARRSLASFRRAHSRNPAFGSPEWSRNSEANSLAPLVLIGSWEPGSAADQGVVSAIARRAYEDVERMLRLLAVRDDPPFILSGNRWQLTSPLDAWNLLRQLLVQADVERWHAQVLQVLTEEDPVTDLQPDERAVARVKGARRAFTSTLRAGLSRSLVLLAVTEPSEASPSGQSWPHVAEVIVGELLGEAPPSIGRWTTLEDVLPALAEAAPARFLRMAGSGLEQSNPTLTGMFRDSDHGAWQNSSPHTGLLWALELLGWSKEFAAQACDVLARLATVDPGGKLANRPVASLRRVLLPWFPQTAATPEERNEIVAGILERIPSIGWPVLLSLLPRRMDNTFPNYRPVFRDWRTTVREVTTDELTAATQAIFDMSLAFLSTHPEGWSEFIEVIPQLPPTILDRALSQLATVEAASFDDERRLKTWRAMLDLAARHRRFRAAWWTLADAQLRRLEDLVATWEPDQAERHARLFDWHPDLADVDQRDLADYDRVLADARRSAIRSVLQGPDSGLRRLIASAKVPGFVGATLAEVSGDDVAGQMISSFAGERSDQLAARGWVIRMSELGGADWIRRMLARASTIPESSRLELYLSLPNTPQTWASIQQEPASTAEAYWQRVGWPVDAESALDFAEHLLAHGRPWSAADVLALRLHGGTSEVPRELIERTLTAAASADVKERPRPGSAEYELGRLLDELESQGSSSAVLENLEWAFLEVLEHTRAPRALFRALGTRPAYFVTLVEHVFKPRHAEARSDVTDNDKATARQSYSLLRLWRRPPGLRQDNSVDGHALSTWVHDARRLLAEIDRSAIGDECIGEMLSGCPPGTDDVWPAEPVRDLLELLKSEKLSEGLAIGKFNARGFTIRGLYDGGRQEMVLAQQYDDWSGRIMARWPESGRILKEMAHTYRSWARHEDAESEGMADSD